MTFAKSERSELCDLLLSVGPAAPTLCAGWDTHDLAAHLWIRENDPVGATGIVAKPLSGLLDRRMGEVRARWDFAELVQRVRKGPARFSVFAIPGVDEGANTTEFFVHHEDVRRGGPDPRAPRTIDADVEDWMWRRLKLLARAWFRRAEVGVVLERLVCGTAAATTEPATESDTIRAVGGSPIVTVIGRPSELMIFAHGRVNTADVQLVGEPGAVQRLLDTDFAV
ncbi:MAG: hypothetical protein JWP61_2681 [Friedmanniella sp.]|nr:hypothetical protein [Friedmanniella sp.]